MEKLERYFSKRLPHADVREIVGSFSDRKQLSKNEYLVSPGQYSTFLAFINKGMFRVYFIDGNGDEMTTWFSFEGMFVTDLLSYYKETAAVHYVKALEESEVSIVQKAQLEKLFLKRPEYREFGRKFAENGMVKLMERMVSLQCLTAEERYKELMNKSDFINRIPLKHLASYLGITDSSLSRIRKNMC